MRLNQNPTTSLRTDLIRFLAIVLPWLLLCMTLSLLVPACSPLAHQPHRNPKPSSLGLRDAERLAPKLPYRPYGLRAND